MSRAFTKESTDDLVAGELPERPVPAHANYVTPQGYHQLQARVRALQEEHERLVVPSRDDSAAQQRLREIERDLRYFIAQLERAKFPVVLAELERAGGTNYRVRVGPFAARPEAETAATRLRREQKLDTWITDSP